jgi:hypothetical protein
VTTCIAAIAWDGLARQSFLVTASDRRMSFDGEFSAEDVIKYEGVHPDWSVMIAGSDVSQCPLVIDRARKLLRGKRNDLRIIQDGFKKAYQEQLRVAITDEFLTPLNMSLEEFKKKGRTQLDPTLHQSLSFGIKNARLGCRFLVQGFEREKYAHIFEVVEPGKVNSRDKPGFWAIGNGASSALNTLSSLGQASEKSSLPETIYNVLAAKYTSESASDVGPKTFLFI